MRRFALFSDVHGNLPALDAVLADIYAHDLDELYCLGDLVGYGPDPAGVIERMRATGIPCIRGNYDDGVGNRRGQCGCYYATDEARLDGAASYAFTDAALSDTDHSWLAALPDSLRLESGDLRDRTDAFLARLAQEADADVVCVGHVHVPYHRVLAASDGRRIDYVSSGSVGKPKDGDPRAGWVEVTLGGAARVSAAVHRVAYDVEAVAAAMKAAGLPPTLAEALRRA
jgi:predicted phosphodiesterase